MNADCSAQQNRAPGYPVLLQAHVTLAYLKRLPIDEIKIDRAFVQDMLTDPDDAALVETIISVAKHMRLNVVAEGVETQAQADFLHSLAPVARQGYLYGRPIAADAWIAHWRTLEVPNPIEHALSWNKQPQTK